MVRFNGNKFPSFSIPEKDCNHRVTTYRKWRKSEGIDFIRKADSVDRIQAWREKEVNNKDTVDKLNMTLKLIQSCMHLSAGQAEIKAVLPAFSAQSG